MEIDFAFVCDYAEIGAKINALGVGFDTIQAPQVPWNHPIFFLVAQLRASITEAGEHSMAIHLIDADGNAVVSEIKGTFPIPKPSGATETKGRIGIALQGVRFLQYGTYSIRLVIDGRELVSLPLIVSRPPTTV